MTVLPRSLADARNHSRQRQLAEANPADAEASEECARAAAARAAIVLPHLELGLPLALLDHGFTGHRYSLEIGLLSIRGDGSVARRPPPVAQLCGLTAAFLLVRA